MSIIHFFNCISSVETAVENLLSISAAAVAIHCSFCPTFIYVAEGTPTPKGVLSKLRCVALMSKIDKESV